jgi:hypothetical protein
MQSGWPDTSFGDTAVNACMKLHIHGIGRKWITIICGDDSVTITTDRELDWVLTHGTIAEQYAKFGMEVEAHVRTSYEAVEFCSARFFAHGETFVLVPKVGKLLGKLCSDMVDRNPKNQAAWLRGITATLEHYGQIDPLLQSLSQSFRRQLGDGQTIVDQLTEYRHKYGKTMTANKLDVAYYYAHHYDMSNGDILKVADLLSHERIGNLCDHPLVVRMVECDV